MKVIYDLRIIFRVARHCALVTAAAMAPWEASYSMDLVLQEPKRPLQRYDIDSLKFNSEVEIIKKERYIFVYSPSDNYQYIAFEGERVGKNFGRIMAIDDGYMLVRELYECGSDRYRMKWMTYLTSMEEPTKLEKFSEITGSCE